MNQGFGRKLIVIALTTLAALMFTMGMAAAWNYGYHSTSNVHASSWGYSSNAYAYNPHHLTQPRHPHFNPWQSRPSGYGLVQQGPAYSPRATVYEDPRFAGHRVSYGSPVYYSAVTGAPRVAPQHRVMSQERYVPMNAHRYTPRNTQRLPTMYERHNTWYGTWSQYP